MKEHAPFGSFLVPWNGKQNQPWIQELFELRMLKWRKEKEGFSLVFHLKMWQWVSIAIMKENKILVLWSWYISFQRLASSNVLKDVGFCLPLYAPRPVSNVPRLRALLGRKDLDRLGMKGLIKSLNPFLKSWLNMTYIQQLTALLAWPNNKPVVWSHTGIPQGSGKRSVKSFKNKFRWIGNQHNANATTTVINIFSTFFLALLWSRTLASVVLPGMCLSHTVTIIIKYKMKITRRGIAYRSTKATMV